MSAQRQLLHLFLSSPSDVPAETRAVKEVLDELNAGVAQQLGYLLAVRDWSQVAPDIGRAQEVILEQLPVAEWDIFLGILWSRFGMPTGAVDPVTGRAYQSGTEQEFRLAYRASQATGRPRILFYRCRRDLPPDLDLEQYGRVRAFFQEFFPQGGNPGLFADFKSAEELEDRVRRDLTRLLFELGRPRQAPEAARPPAPTPAPVLPEAPPGRLLEQGGLSVVEIPAGPFRMGRAATDGDDPPPTSPLASPEHAVEPGRYLISRTPVTQAQYRRFVAATGHRPPFRDDEWSRPYNWDRQAPAPPPGLDEHPVVLVSWHDAAAFCRWAGGRLPTEAEWEKAARGTDGRRWPWGNAWQDGRANASTGGEAATTPVGRYSPRGDSPFGLQDVAGNVWEWTSSLPDPYPYRAADGREEASARGPRVVRGGAFGASAEHASCTFRSAIEAEEVGFTVGFRVVFDPVAADPAGRLP